MPIPPRRSRMTAGRLYLVRHARTAGNRVRYLGWGDEPLDEVGREQVDRLTDRLAREPIDIVYSSPLRRALDTARPLAERHGVALRVREALKELHYGDYEGAPKGERKLRPKRFYRVRRMPGGESLHDVFDRVGRLLDEIEPELSAGRNVAVVAHFWSLRMLAGHLENLGFDEVLARDDYSPENGSATSRFSTRLA